MRTAGSGPQTIDGQVAGGGNVRPSKVSDLSSGRDIARVEECNAWADRPGFADAVVGLHRSASSNICEASPTLLRWPSTTVLPLRDVMQVTVPTGRPAAIESLEQ